MTALVAPDTRRWRSWADMVVDFGEVAGMHGSGHWFLDGAPVPTEAGCAQFVTMTEVTSAPDLDGRRVASSYFWITADDGDESDEVVGFLNLRHTLNQFLLDEGGHIGYSVKPSARRRGHASAALTLALREAAALGIDPALVTCDVRNEGSRRTIERHGGRLEDERNGNLRFWVPTAAAP